MADEPVLRKGTSSQWVMYLQQLLAYFGVWDGPQDGTFDDNLEGAVTQFQTNNGIAPTGVVDQDTWSVLDRMSDKATAAQGQPMHGTGAQPSQDPHSLSVGGLPAFTYTLPDVPIATVSSDVGGALLEVSLKLVGSVTITFPHAAQGVALDQDGWQAQAQASLSGVTDGIQINGLGSDSPSISSTFGTAFNQNECRFKAPNTMSFIGQAVIGYDAQWLQIPAHVEGWPGFELEVKVWPHQAPEVEPTDAPSWFSQNSGWLTVGAGLVLLGIGIALAPATGGGSLVLAGA